MDVLNSGFLPTYDQLYEHQKEGIVFLYEAYQSEKNGVILGDEMGLGKTIQIIVFLGGMLDMGKIKSVLLVLPKSLLQNWIEELKKWTPLIQLSEFDVKNRDTVKNIQQKGGVLLITYKNLIKGQKILSSYKEKHFTWDCVIFDEAHFIRNRSSKCFKAACLIPAKIRLLLSGIPVHKNLQEMWSLFHLACQGGLLGTYATFKKQFEQPILKGMEKTSSGKHKALGLKRAEMLMKVIEPYYFRRTKEEIQRKWQVSDQESYPLLDAVKMAHFTRKNDYVVWVYLSPIQETLYKTLLSMRTLRDSLDSNYNDLITLKKICDHPRLLSHTECRDLEWEDDGELDLSALQVTLEIRERLFPQLSSESLLEESGKLAFLVPLLERLRDEGNRTLVFSRSLKMLDIIEYILKERGFNILRLDGTNCKTYKIQERVTLFQTKKDCSVFLLTCQVGGVGLNLTAANRVVIVDPSWNPATDDQAVARVDRIGQEKDMVIYRLITCGTVEEKIYRWQVFKNTLIKQTTGDDTNPIRYFSNQEIYELFTLENTQSSSTQLQLQNFHHHRRVIDKALDDHLAYLYSLKMFGISEHDLINSTALDRDFAKDTPCNRIHLQVQKNEQRIQAESHMGFKKTEKTEEEAIL
ncbi:DNA excision repair protein ERCC-6-like [Amia ocellicauda]|uniref:DNA excision repair protein ERCC-6-like n=1 Tax=Amia ocellicauda TaxID=2972642 RepID=UPI003464A37E